jgi:para-aminobenzoate synthetase / 4-amino-4-deoxychorismate lyase
MATVPDPRHGVFTTLLVINGRPIELDAHLERLSASLAELFPSYAAPNLGEIDVPVERGSLRITVIPVSNKLKVQTSVRKVGQHSRPVALNSLPIPGGLGAHKWADRALLDEAQSELPDSTLPLIIEDDGTVLEASRANVFAVRDGALFTPPLDGRILPGITRMRILEIAGEIGIDVYEAELPRADLLSAEEVFVTGSVRGIERVAYLDRTPLGGSEGVTARLTTELWQLWAGAKTAI